MQEMHKIQNFSDRIDLKEKLNPIWFKRDDFIQYARRFHKYIIKALLESDPKTHHLAENSPSFDASVGILWISGKPVKFGTKTYTYQCLKAIFSDSDLSREWFFSEIAEAIDEAKPKSDKLIHNYFNNTIKQKIIAETGIKDFFMTDNQSVKINENYLVKKS